MRCLLDACVLYPTIVREVLTGVAAEGAFTPLWSPRILEEWRRAALRHGEDDRVTITLLEDRFRGASVDVPEEAVADLSLPDNNDRHVLAAAIAGRADAIITFNLKDFPGRTLARYGVQPLHPDAFLWSLHGEAPEQVARVIHDTHARAEAAYGQPYPLRKMLKRSHLPRMGKLLG
ncbi:putative nucleic acid-binding protein [Rubricella aquisinus]|uniref:Putative nucleic acid-binding protein n=1 Tax=Rubricella aquisinus TaxID=2028108 RepID=A0A840X1X3_9RHOB|nr:PIN domain-containing protein [Rubricella aquisinus]MBB5515885.1 putative nucleic acid-binding protein [Rubricella aquisinus]